MLFRWKKDWVLARSAQDSPTENPEAKPERNVLVGFGMLWEMLFCEGKPQVSSLEWKHDDEPVREGAS